LFLARNRDYFMENEVLGRWGGSAVLALVILLAVTFASRGSGERRLEWRLPPVLQVVLVIAGAALLVGEQLIQGPGGKAIWNGESLLIPPLATCAIVIAASCALLDEQRHRLLVTAVVTALALNVVVVLHLGDEYPTYVLVWIVGNLVLMGAMALHWPRDRQPDAPAEPA
jgi:hypothetical protein